MRARGAPDGFISIAPKIAGKERKIMGRKKGMHLLRRSIFELIHFTITSLTLFMKIQLFPRIFGHRVISGERTTNACETFHSAFGKYFYSPHPNIFVFYKVLKIM
jgi:hypothetical protein